MVGLHAKFGPQPGLRPRPRPAPLPLLKLSLQFADPRHRSLLPRHSVARWVRAALQAPAEMTVRVVGAEEGQALNSSYRGRNYATNVLTFEYAHEPLVQADLVICAPVVEKEAHDFGISVQAHYAHLLVHGTLHAQGFDHEDSEAQALEMESLESRVMQALGFADPYGGSHVSLGAEP